MVQIHLLTKNLQRYHQVWKCNKFSKKTLILFFTQTRLFWVESTKTGVLLIQTSIYLSIVIMKYKILNLLIRLSNYWGLKWSSCVPIRVQVSQNGYTYYFHIKFISVRRKKFRKCGKNDIFYHIKSIFLLNGKQYCNWKIILHYMTNRKMVKYYWRVDFFPPMQKPSSKLT